MIGSTGMDFCGGVFSGMGRSPFRQRFLWEDPIITKHTIKSRIVQLYRIIMQEIRL